MTHRHVSDCVLYVIRGETYNMEQFMCEPGIT